jgi:hypothetical protein
MAIHVASPPPSAIGLADCIPSRPLLPLEPPPALPSSSPLPLYTRRPARRVEEQRPMGDPDLVNSIWWTRSLSQELQIDLAIGGSRSESSTRIQRTATSSMVSW